MKKYYDDPKQDAAFNRWVDVTARLMLKYGPKVLRKLEVRKIKEEKNIDIQDPPDAKIVYGRMAAYLEKYEKLKSEKSA